MNLKLTLASWTLTIIISCTESKEHKQEILDQEQNG